MGIEISGLDILIQKAYHLLGLATYLTAGEQSARVDIPPWHESSAMCGNHPLRLRAWIYPCTETVAYADLLEYGSMTAAKKRKSSSRR